MKIFSCLAIMLAILSLPSFGQKNYQPATIVTIKGDSIRGEIDYKNWKQNPSKILFRKDKSSEAMSYGIADLESFTVSGDIYRRAIVEIDDREDRVSRLSTSDSIITHTDTVFLQAVISGARELYYYHDLLDHYYIAKENSFELLRYKKYARKAENMLPSNGTKFIRFRNEYVSQLQEYLNDCPTISTNLAKMQYTLGSLRKAFMSYYSCASAAPGYVEKPENEKVEIGVLAGVSNTTFNVRGSTYDVIARANYTSSVDAAGGVFFDIVFPRQRGRISLNNELFYSAFKTKGNYRAVTTPVRYEQRDYTFGYSYFKFNTMLRYKFFLDNASIFINGGVSNGVALSEVNELKKYNRFETYETTYNEKGFSPTRKYELGFLFGAGFRRQRAAIELRTERGGGPFNAAGLAAPVTRYFALLSYRIN